MNLFSAKHSTDLLKCNVKLKLGTTSILFLADTGASLTAINEQVYNSLPESERPTLRPSLTTHIICGDGMDLTVLGEAPVTLNDGEEAYDVTILVVRGMCLPGVLGMDTFRAHQPAGVQIQDGENRCYLRGNTLGLDWTYHLFCKTSKHIKPYDECNVLVVFKEAKRYQDLVRHLAEDEGRQVMIVPHESNKDDPTFTVFPTLALVKHKQRGHYFARVKNHLSVPIVLQQGRLIAAMNPAHKTFTWVPNPVQPEEPPEEGDCEDLEKQEPQLRAVATKSAGNVLLKRMKVSRLQKRHDEAERRRDKKFYNSHDWQRAVDLEMDRVQNMVAPLAQIELDFMSLSAPEAEPLAPTDSLNSPLLSDDPKETRDEQGMKLWRELVDRAVEGGETVEDQENIRSTLEKCADCFSKGKHDLGRVKVDHHIIKLVDVDAAPPRVPPRRMRQDQRAAAAKIVNDLERNGLVTKGQSPYASPIVMASKKDGSPRLCMDYRKLNENTIRDAWPLPRIDDTIDQLRGAKYFCTLDMASGYWQIEMSEKERERTAFVTLEGQYVCNTLPFGLKNAPAVFSRLMDSVITTLPPRTALSYLDDIIIWGATVPETLLKLERVLRAFREAGLKFGPKKCELFKREVLFLGMIISADGVRKDPSKVQAIVDWPVPQCLRDLQSFLGLSNFYRKFVSHFSDIATPLYAMLTVKKQDFYWNDSLQRAMDLLKIALSEDVVLEYPDWSKPFILDTDASNYAIGAVLQQYFELPDGKEALRPIAYFSLTLSKAERNYCVTQRELLAVVKAIKHFKPYLGAHFTVRTDHGSLTWLRRLRETEGQIARWQSFLQTFDFDIQYVQGRHNDAADAMSRRPCDPQDCIRCVRHEHRSGTCIAAEDEDVLDDDMDPLVLTEGDTRPLLNILLHGMGPQLPPTPPLGPHYLYLAIRQPNPPVFCTYLKSYPCLGVLGDTKNHQVLRALAFQPGEKLSLQKIAETQDRDDDLKVLKQSVIDGIQPEREALTDVARRLLLEHERLVVKDQVLCRKFYPGVRMTGHDENTFFLQLIIPRELQKDLLDLFHAAPPAGHLGWKKTYHRLSQRFYWYGMRTDCESFCRLCVVCQKKKRVSKKVRCPMGRRGAASPFTKLSVDLMTNLPAATLNGEDHTNILVCCDYFTKWMLAIPLPEHSAERIAGALIERVFSVFGVPCIIHSDQGADFESSLMQELCRHFSINKTRTCIYRPQANGQVERANRTIQEMLKGISNVHKDWPAYLPWVTFAYNTAVHAATGYSPFRMNFGRRPRMPQDLLTGLAPDEEPTLVSEYVDHLRAILDRVHACARENLEAVFRSSKRLHDAELSPIVYSVGDVVWMQKKQFKRDKTKKLTEAWDGPFVVVKKFSDVAYRILQGPHHKPKIVHAELLKPFLGDADCSWYKEWSQRRREPAPEPQAAARTPRQTRKRDKGTPKTRPRLRSLPRKWYI